MCVHYCVQNTFFALRSVSLGSRIIDFFKLLEKSRSKTHFFTESAGSSDWIENYFHPSMVVSPELVNTAGLAFLSPCMNFFISSMSFTKSSLFT